MNDYFINKKNLAEAILETIAFFDLFDYPLTDFEIWKYCGLKCSLKEVKDILPKKEIKNIQSRNGFYFLTGRENICDIRSSRYNETSKKFKIALSMVGLLKFVPWIKMIAVGNIIGANNLKADGDIDLFIITERKKIWITRFFCVGLAMLLRSRPTEKTAKNKICLSFFISEERLNIKNLLLKEKKDVYFIFWLAGLAPVYEENSFYQKFIKANDWLYGYLPNWQKSLMAEKRRRCKSSSNYYKETVNLFFGGLDKTVKKWQLKIMPAKLKMELNKSSKVAASDFVLKFHSNDRREDVYEKWQQKINKFYAPSDSNNFKQAR